MSAARGPDEPDRAGAGALGMAIFLASLSVFFLASIVGYLAVRHRAETWPPPGTPSLPGGLWVSTMAILLSSVAIQWGHSSIRRGRQRAFRWGILLTTILGVAFLVVQALNWAALVAAQVTARSSLYAFTFYVLTGLHAVHVLGGLIPIALVTVNAWRGRYTGAHYPRVRYCALYWHFLAVVWGVMFAVLVLTS